MLDSIGQRLRSIRESKELTIDQLAELCGLTPGHIGRIERNHSQNPRFDTIEKLAQALEIDSSLILYSHSNGNGNGKPKKAFDAPNYIPRDIPVIGLTRAGRGGFFNDSGYPHGEGLRKVHRPIDIKDPNAYALSVEGDSMSPMIEAGWIVYVCPNHECNVGDLVVVCLETEEIMLKKLCQQDDMILLQSVNASYGPLMLKKEEIRFMHKVCLIKPK